MSIMIRLIFQKITKERVQSREIREEEIGHSLDYGGLDDGGGGRVRRSGSVRD